jgi:tetratricopeptide (TPR) repeat protein
MGKLFKSEKNYEKALLAFEECFYLGFSMDDYRLKIKSIVLISSCYLEIGDLHKAILYYQKLIDIETYLLESQENMVQTEFNATNEEIINLELRIAIRQNLYMTHLRYLNRLIYHLKRLLICSILIFLGLENYEFVHIISKSSSKS